MVDFVYKVSEMNQSFFVYAA